MSCEPAEDLQLRPVTSATEEHHTNQLGVSADHPWSRFRWMQPKPIAQTEVPRATVHRVL